MPKFEVKVQKTVTGTVRVEAEDEDAAKRIVRSANGVDALHTLNIDWAIGRVRVDGVVNE